MGPGGKSDFKMRLERLNMEPRKLQLFSPPFRPRAGSKHSASAWDHGLTKGTRGRMLGRRVPLDGRAGGAKVT